jgi:neutral/alkaline ceramidase-like enzyme
MIHRVTFSFLFAIAALRADVVEQGPKDSKPSGLLAGVARADITPPVGIAHLNWGSQTHITAEGIDPLGMKATAVVLSDGRQKFAMVDVDVLHIHRLDDVSKRASELTGIPADHIRLGATHTHSGPVLSLVRGPVGADLSIYEKKVWSYWDILADKIVGAIVEANSKLQPAHMYGSRGTGTININRRLRASAGRPAGVGFNPDGFLDRELVTFRIDNAQGKPLAVIANFQCHGTVMAWENKLITPDWIGMTRKVVEDSLPGAKCLFFQGAAGNQGPVEGFTGDLSVAHRLGAILGHQVSALALQTETVRREPKFEFFVESTAFLARQPWRVAGPRDATLKFTSRVLDLPPRTYSRDEIANMELLVADAEKRLEGARAGGDQSRIYQAGARHRRLRDLLAMWKDTRDPAPKKVRVQILRIGDLALVSMPGEAFAEIGVAIKKASPFAFTMFCGYSNGEGGDYMPIESEYPHGGYEVERTPFGVKAAEKLIRETVALYPTVK